MITNPVVIVAPKEELEDRVIDGIIVVREGSNLEDDPSTIEASIMMVQESISLGGLGRTYSNNQKRVYFQSGKLDTLKKLVKQLNLKAGSKLPGYKIIVKEDFTPSHDRHEPKVFPAGHPREGEAITSEGALVYRTSYLVEANSPEGDEFLRTDKEPALEPMEANEGAFQAEG